MTNMDAFNEIAAAVLEELLKSFPLSIMLGPPEHRPEVEALFSSTIIFLGKQGLLEYEMVSDDGTFFGLVLTGKGLAALNAMPEILEEKEERHTFAQRISGAIKTGSKEAVKAAINQFITAVATGRIHFPY